MKQALSEAHVDLQSNASMYYVSCRHRPTAQSTAGVGQMTVKFTASLPITDSTAGFSNQHSFYRRLDYCNSLLSRLPGSTIPPLQRVMNAAARVIMNLSLRVETVTLAAGWAKNNLQAVFVYALHPHRTSTKIPFRLCFHSFCSQWQISTEVHWLSGLRSAKNKDKIKIWWTWLLILRPSRLEHSSIRPSWHYWYEYIPKTTQECTFCAYNWLMLALLDESYSGAL